MYSQNWVKWKNRYLNVSFFLCREKMICYSSFWLIIFCSFQFFFCFIFFFIQKINVCEQISNYKQNLKRIKCARFECMFSIRISYLRTVLQQTFRDRALQIYIHITNSKIFPAESKENQLFWVVFCVFVLLIAYLTFKSFPRLFQDINSKHNTRCTCYKYQEIQNYT